MERWGAIDDESAVLVVRWSQPRYRVPAVELNDLKEQEELKYGKDENGSYIILLGQRLRMLDPESLSRDNESVPSDLREAERLALAKAQAEQAQAAEERAKQQAERLALGKAQAEQAHAAEEQAEAAEAHAKQPAVKAAMKSVLDSFDAKAIFGTDTDEEKNEVSREEDTLLNSLPELVRSGHDDEWIKDYLLEKQCVIYFFKGKAGQLVNSANDYFSSPNENSELYRKLLEGIIDYDGIKQISSIDEDPAKMAKRYVIVIKQAAICDFYSVLNHPTDLRPNEEKAEAIGRRYRDMIDSVLSEQKGTSEYMPTVLLRQMKAVAAKFSLDYVGDATTLKRMVAASSVPIEQEKAASQQATTSSEVTVPVYGLVAYFPLSGNANDASGNGLDAVVYGATLTTDRHGNSNSAYSFGLRRSTPNTDYIATKGNIGIVGNADRSVSLWFYLDNANPRNPYGNLISWGSSGADIGGVFSVVYEPWQTVGYNFSINAAYIKHGWRYNGTIPAGKWHHLIVTYTTNLGSAAMYLDGAALEGMVSPGCGTNEATLNTRDSPLMINSFLMEGYGIEGRIADVRVYNRALSAAEAATLYSAELGGVGKAEVRAAAASRDTVSGEERER